MPYPLSPQERAVLHQLEVEIEREDPLLAERFRPARRPGHLDGSPGDWVTRGWVVAGIVFLVLGILLTVPSSYFGGLGALTVAAWRSPRWRLAIRQARQASRRR